MITMTNDTGADSVYLEAFFELLITAAKCLESQFTATISRRECLIPLIESRNVRELLRNSHPDTYIFGSKLESEIKRSKESEALFSSERDSSSYRQRSGNSSRLFDRGPRSNFQGNTYSSDRGRRRLHFRQSSPQGQYRGRLQNGQKHQTYSRREYQHLKMQVLKLVDGERNTTENRKK